MAVRIEDAGFEIRDMIAWVYGSGFPKSHDVSKAIDKASGAHGEYGGKKPNIHSRGDHSMHDGWKRPCQDDPDAVDRSGREYLPATDAAKQWAGWGTALKPALEPITVARKPFTGTVAANVLEHGTGAINVDGCRVASDPDNDPNQRSPKWYDSSRYDDTSNCYGRGLGGSRGTPNLSAPGRWPANLIHDGSDEVVGMFPETKNGGKQGANRMSKGSGGESTGNIYGVYKSHEVIEYYGGDSGSAARFFYCAKASSSDRGKANNHPTVKPTDLMRYLCRLVTPPNGIVLDPFMGSGSTGKAAILEGFQFIGIEREAEYVEIARARIEHAIKTKPNTLF
jgi:site-specific DNA-methyltransferase (adenine-specific)